MQLSALYRHLLGPDYTETYYSPRGEEITTSPQNMVGFWDSFWICHLRCKIHKSKNNLKVFEELESKLLIYAMSQQI